MDIDLDRIISVGDLSRYGVSRSVRDVQTLGPIVIFRGSTPAAVLISLADYAVLRARADTP